MDSTMGYTRRSEVKDPPFISELLFADPSISNGEFACSILFSMGIAVDMGVPKVMRSFLLIGKVV